MRQIAWYTAIVLATLAGLFILWEFREALLLFMLSLAIAAAFRPLIDFFTGRRLRRGVALLLAYLIILGLVAGILALIGGPLLRDIEQATNQFITTYDRIRLSWPDSEILFQQMLANQLPPSQDLFGSLVNEEGFQGLMGITTNLFGFFTSLVSILILSLYWSADSIHFERLLLSLIPVDKRPTVRRIWRGIDKGTGAYIRSEFIQSMLAGLLLWVGYSLIGLDYPVLLAFIGSLAWLIPWFGAVFAVVPALLVGLGSGILPGILAAVYTVLVLAVMEYIIEPRIFKRTYYSSVILVLVVLALAQAYGLVGLILAPLVSAVLQIVVKYLLEPATSSVAPASAPEEVPAVLASSLVEQLAETRAALSAQDEPASPEIMSLMQRLESLILAASQYLDQESGGEKPASG